MKIILADNQQLTAAGLLSFLRDRADLELSVHISNPGQLAETIEKITPDLLVVDYNLSGFVTINDLQKLTREKPDLNILVLSSDNDKGNIMKVLQLGVKGYLTKECSRDEVLMAIQSTSRGEKFFCHKILDILMEKHFKSESVATEATILTVRESEVLTMIAKGKSSQQIADSLHLSPHTIQSHRKSIIRKLQIKSPTEFVIYAMDLGLIKSR